MPGQSAERDIGIQEAIIFDAGVLGFDRKQELLDATRKNVRDFTDANLEIRPSRSVENAVTLSAGHGNKIALRSEQVLSAILASDRQEGHRVCIHFPIVSRDGRDVAIRPEIVESVSDIFLTLNQAAKLLTVACEEQRLGFERVTQAMITKGLSTLFTEKEVLLHRTDAVIDIAKRAQDIKAASASN